jgi:hypothetical protein
MSTLTYANQDVASVAPALEQPLRKSFWRRLFDALMESQQRRAEREIARYLASHGGLLTDDMEREMMRRLTGSTRKLF